MRGKNHTVSSLVNMSRIFIFGNGYLCLKCIDIIYKAQNTLIVGMCLNSKERQKNKYEILKYCPEDCYIIDFDQLQSSQTIEDINKLKIDLAFSLSFGHILTKDFLLNIDFEIINLHTSYLPYNRGSATNVFSIINDFPAGVTLHKIDYNIDTGDIYAQEKLDVLLIDDGESTYNKLNNLAVNLFKTKLVKLLNGTLKPYKQSESFPPNTVRDLSKLDYIDLEKTYKAKDLINILRARTFGSYQSAYFLDKHGKKIFIRVRLNYE